MPKASLESVLVIGAGTIGLSIVQALRIMGAGKITVIEPDAAKRALALKLGAAEVWAPGELAADVRFTGAIDVVAAQATLNDACTRVYAGGTVQLRAGTMCCERAKPGARKPATCGGSQRLKRPALQARHSMQAGVDADIFGRAVSIAMKGGASGFLAGRAVWASVVGAQDPQTMLRDVSVPRLQRTSVTRAAIS